jgi:EAL domain-containing protein (putative c-di-GMP-specific phosphodiesterase class I)
MPANFIAMAEESELITDMAKVVLRAALQQTRRCHDAGHDLDMAVNVSMANLSSLEFPDFVARQANEAGVPINRLMLELTESQLMSDPLAQLDILTRLRLKGVRLSIDDFGIGYSTLAQLRDVPFDELKIDRSFVHGSAQDPSLRAILEASLGLARQLGLTTVAEGIEEREDWDFLRASGCDLAQGYFVAKPMAGEDLIDWIGSWQERRPHLTSSMQLFT